MIDAAPAATDHMATVDDPSAVSEPTAEGHSGDELTSSHAASPDGRKPNKFMADLTRAMQGAAETARADSLARFAAEAKTHIENIHASTALEATELRKQADDDVAAIREWSKSEIARIREETDERITHRKARLEREVEAHAAEIEERIERVQRRVDAFEAEMAAFFERLMGEEDATRVVAMAESLPEPPPFDVDVIGDSPVAEATPAETDQMPAERAVVVDPWPETPAETVEGADAPETIGFAETEVVDEQPAEETPAETEAVAETEAAERVDPRIEAMGLTPDFASAEAEAAAFTPEEAMPEEEIAVIADDALAARLAGLVPDAEASGSESITTRVVVTGLVSVASIATFKRTLARVSGVRSVGVSSGPDGEFLFAVNHDSSVVLRDAITTLPGFGARVTAEAEGELTVTARDPESEG